MSTDITRLAVIERGQPAVRLLAAIGALDADSGEPPITRVLVLTEPRERAWYAREADETVEVATGAGPTRTADVVEALVGARADAVWIGQVPCQDQVALVTACEGAGLAVIGPSSATVRRLADPEGLSTAVTEAGLTRLDPAEDLTGHRLLEVDIVADSAGTVWALGPRDVTVRRGEHLVLAETPPAGLEAGVAEHLAEGARALARVVGYRGAGVVHYALARDGTTAYVIGVDSLARADHALLEEATGSSLLGLRIRLARGDLLVRDEPRLDGHAVEARLLAQDPEHGFAPSGGTLQLLSMPADTGVRVDTSLHDGDVVDAAIDPLIATITAWGHGRAEALARLRRALHRTVVVLSGGGSNRCGLIALLARAEVVTGAVVAGWYEDLLTSGDLVATADPLAVVAAAVEAYEADLSMVRSAFFASAEQGRPERPEAVGTHVQLSYRGTDYRLRVDRTRPDRYRIHDDVTVEARVDQLGPHTRQVTCGGRRRRVVAGELSGAFRLEIDGVAHTVTRVDGLVVRAGWPALVSQILVEQGQDVRTGEPVAVLESMKMVTTVTAPFDGIVTSVPVVANSQVERGAPLLRIRASGDVAAAAALASAERPEGALDLGVLAVEGSTGPEPRCEQVYADLVPYLLGYDRDPAEVRDLVREQKDLSTTRPPDDEHLAACEDRLLDLFADIAALYRPRSEAEDLGDGAQELVGNTQEYFIAFLRWLDADRAALPAGYRVRLETTLARYGVNGLTRTRGLQTALLWMFRSFSRVPELAPVVGTILERRLAHVDQLRAHAGPELRRRLQRLTHAAVGHQQVVADLARDVEFHYFDAPVLDAVVADVETEMTGHLAALRDDAHRPDRADRVDRLVWCPQPLRGLLLRAWLDGLDDPRLTAYRECILEAYLRRFYRIRELHGLDHDSSGEVQLVHADYEHEGTPVHVVVAYVPTSDLPALSRTVATHLRAVPEHREVVVDVALWRHGTCPTIEELTSMAAGWLAGCDFGRPLHRLDLTVTSTESADTGALRTQHLTFRQPHGGAFVEDELYRNLHPMLGKRLDLWRLSNFDLERLPSPEDVYLFHGRAHDNPKDHRLFALAEVRDMVGVRDEETGRVTYPRLGRMGLQALAAMRTALAAYPPRERPAANRLVLSIRPTWDIPASALPALAAQYEPLARGAGLEKLVLHIQVPDTDARGRPTLTERVIHVEGIGRAGTSIRVSDPGPNPVRPLTRYAQKLLTARRFGAPYPYEVVQLLTPADAGTSAFPRGSWTELDLDADGDTLVPVDRPPAENTAHLVVGLLTSYTDVVPEGMTRVALLSDPTQGLGNLAEPECRRVNAALAYAGAHGLPVEWYAVSSGALIAMDSGTENMDWIALTLRRLIEFTQAGGEVNIVVTGINVGGQPYWNAEATMLVHTRGILVMTPASAMVLTGKQALDFSGAISAEDNFGIGGYDRVMGPNGQAQYWAPSFQDACAVLLRHYDYTYVVPGERFPRRRPTRDPLDRDVRTSPHDPVAGTTFTTVGQVFDDATNPDRKQPFDMRSVMRAVTDSDREPLERWRDWLHADTSIAWDATVGGIPVSMLGLESRTVPRKGFVPADGPPSWTSGTLFPQSSRKTARVVNAASGNRPLVVLANLSGFDGSPESMRHWQLEYGAEIGRAVTNFDGPIVFVVVSRYHGGAFVVFSKALNESIEIAAVEGSYASVIGGAPAAATVFAREVRQRTENDPRVQQARAQADAATGLEAARARSAVATITASVRSQKLGEVADEFDAIHTIERARRVGSVDAIIAPADLRPWVVAALERGMARFTG